MGSILHSSVHKHADESFSEEPDRAFAVTAMDGTAVGMQRAGYRSTVPAIALDPPKTPRSAFDRRVELGVLDGCQWPTTVLNLR